MALVKLYPSVAVAFLVLAGVMGIPDAHACSRCSLYTLTHNGGVGDLSSPDASVPPASVTPPGPSSSIEPGSITAGLSGGLQFHLTEVPNEISLDVRNGFITAANYWSSVVADTGFTVSLKIGFRDIGMVNLAGTGSNLVQQTYSDFRNRLAFTQTSGDDATALGSLQPGTSFAMLLNGTSNNPNGSGSRTPYIDNDGDANNSTIRMTTANARVLGLAPNYGTGDNAFDGLVTFNNQFAFDFDPTDGIAPGTYDFVGVATHEIGHALGFISGVNTLDTNNALGNYQTDEQVTYVSPVDIFRYTALSAITSSNGVTGIPDFTLGTYSPDFVPGGGTLNPVDQYLSLDNGATALAALSTGRNFGDGQQASHWKDNQDLGILDPTSFPGELRRFSANDLRLFDSIGYTLRPGALASVSAPEPGSLALVLFAGMMLVRRSRRRRG